MVLLSTVSQYFDTVLQCFWHCFTITLRYSGALPDDSADAAPSEAELYEDLDFGDQSPNCKFLEYSHFACVIVHLENHFHWWISRSKKFLECPPSCDGVSNTVWHSYKLLLSFREEIWHYVCHLMFYLSLHPSVFTSTQQLCFRKLTTTPQFQEGGDP